MAACWFPYQHGFLLLKGDAVRLEWGEAQIMDMNMGRKKDHLPPHHFPHWGTPLTMGSVGPEVYTEMEAVVCLPELPSPPTRSFPSRHEGWLRWLAAEASLRTCLCPKAAAIPRSCLFLRRQPRFLSVACKAETIYSLSPDRKGFLTLSSTLGSVSCRNQHFLLPGLPFPQKGPASRSPTTQIQPPPFTIHGSLTLHFVDSYNLY